MIQKITTNRIPALENISYFAAIFAAFLFSFPQHIMNFGYAMWMIIWAVEIMFRRNIRFEKPSKQNLHLYLLLAYFGWFVVSLLWTTNFHEAQISLQRRISFLIFPLLALFGVNNNFNFKTILYFFLLGTIVSVIIHLLLGIYEYSIFQDFVKAPEKLWDLYGEGVYKHRFFYEHNIWPIIPTSKDDFYIAYISIYKHRTFFSVCMIISSLIFTYLKNDLIKKMPLYIYWIICICLNFAFLVYIYSAGGRMALIIYIVVLASSIAYILWEMKYRIAMLGSVALMILGMGLLLSIHPRMKNFELKHEALEKFDPRFAMWSSSLAAVKDNILLGSGIGDRKDVFAKYYNAYPLENKRVATSTHNNFIDNQLELGLIGTILLLAIIISSIRGGSKKNAVIIMGLSIAWILTSVIESTGGITSVYLFVFFLLFMRWLKDSRQTEMVLNDMLVFRPLILISVISLLGLCLFTAISALFIW